MKSKVLFWVPGAIALLIAAAPVLPSFTNAAVAGPGRMGERSEKLEQLNLSEAQKAEMTRIREATRQQLETVFTEEQREQMRVAREQRQRPTIALSDTQKAQLKAIYEESRRQMQAVLTEQQQQQLEQMRSTRGQQRRDRNGQPQSQQMREQNDQRGQQMRGQSGQRGQQMRQQASQRRAQ